MDFKVGDHVIYCNEGVCDIIEINEFDFGPGLKKYYVLKPHFVINKKKFWIPFDCKEKTLRKPISKRKAQEAVKEINNVEVNWINDNRKRKDYFQKLLDNGDILSLASISKTVKVKKKEFLEKKKSMPLTDQNLAVSCEKLVNEELAIALGIKVEDVPAYIEKRNK